MHKWIILTLSLVLLQISRHGAKAAHATEVPMQKELVVAVVLDESGSMGSDKSTYLNALDIGISKGNTMQFNDANWKGGIRALATETAVHMNTGAQNFGASVSAAGGFFTSTETMKVKEETPK